MISLEYVKKHEVTCEKCGFTKLDYLPCSICYEGEIEHTENCITYTIEDLDFDDVSDVIYTAVDWNQFYYDNFRMVGGKNMTETKGFCDFEMKTVNGIQTFYLEGNVIISIL